MLFLLGVFSGSSSGPVIKTEGNEVVSVLCSRSDFSDDAEVFFSRRRPKNDREKSELFFYPQKVMMILCFLYFPFFSLKNLVILFVILVFLVGLLLVVIKVLGGK